MKTHATFPGKAYTVTSAADCTVSTPAGVVITTHSPGAQTLFIAPTAEVVVSDDAALITEAFKGAALSVQGGGGLTEADVEKLLTLEYNDITLSTPNGTQNASCNIVELDPERVPVGVLTELTYRTGSSTATGMTTEPIWCAVYELAEGSTTEYVLVGVSTNTVTQAINLTLAWQFNKLPIHGRRLRLVPTIDRENIEAAILRVRTTTSTDTTCCINSGTSYAFTPQLSITARQARMRFAPAAHVDDSSMHVSEAERESWNAAARGELTPEQMSVLGALMPETLGGVKVVSKDAEGSENGSLRVIVTSYAENIVGNNPMTIQAPSITYATAHAAASYTDTQTGTSYVFWGHTTDEAEMAAYGITEPCVWLGDASLPTLLRGSEIRATGRLLVNNVVARTGGHINTGSTWDFTSGFWTAKGNCDVLVVNNSFACDSGNMTLAGSPVVNELALDSRFGDLAEVETSTGEGDAAETSTALVYNGSNVTTEARLDERFGYFRVNASGRYTFANSNGTLLAWMQTNGTFLFFGQGSFLDKITFNSALTCVGDASFYGSLTKGGEEVATVADVAAMKMPVGALVPSLASAMDGYLLCDGTSYDGEEYPELYQALYGAVPSTGDLITLPDLRGRTLWGASDTQPLGSAIEAGAPEIEGQFGYSGVNSEAYGMAVSSVSGAFSKVLSNPTAKAITAGSTNPTGVSLSAARSNPIYGNSETIQPPAVAVNFFISCGIRVVQEEANPSIQPPSEDDFVAPGA